MDTFDEFLKSYPPEVQAICRKLHALVKSAMPEAYEHLYASQNHISYSNSESARDEMIYLVPMKDYVRLGFFWGGNLPDPDHLLIGAGKRLRHVKVRTLDEAGLPALKGLIEAAWADAALQQKKKKPK
jgi:hypothetical protein